VTIAGVDITKGFRNEARTQELAALRSQYVARGVSNVNPIVAKSLKGATITDVDGRTYIDWAGGIGVLNVGAGHPEVVQAIQEQAAEIVHACFHVTMYESYIRLAEALARLTPGNFPKKSLLVSTGVEAVENAVKLARKYTGRQAVIALENGFHGRTLLGMSLTGKADPYRLGFGPFAPEIYRAPFPYVYRSATPDDPSEASRQALEELERVITVEVGAGNVAALIAEPVQGESGFIMPPLDFFPGVAAICRKYGILFIADEIQTGFHRTGPLFAVQHWGVEPDLLLSAKSLAGGMPLAAVTGRAEIMDSSHVGGLGGTYGGNPVACAAALKVIEIMEREDFAARARHVGEQVTAGFEALARKHSIIGEVRGLGAMVAMELVKDRATREPNAEANARVVKYAYEHGLVLMKAGIYGNVIRFLAPLSISDQEIADGLSILDAALAEAQK
jgi:4-aminobutyrate aminotransferase/(S)-3-amino-2-methylpropionate transaminase